MRRFQKASPPPDSPAYQLRVWTDERGVGWHVWLHDRTPPYVGFVSHERTPRTIMVDVSEVFVLEEASDRDLSEMLGVRPSSSTS